MQLFTDEAICAATLRQGSRSFALAALLLPPRARRHARALYGFCRVADDLIDQTEPHTRAAAIHDLHARLDAAYAGRPFDTPIDRAFASAVASCEIPRALPEALLDGFAWDAEGRRYRTLGDLRAYAARVAGTVGAMMALVLGARGPQALARACDLGVAMQLSNICRDIAEDAQAGRLYLPLDWFAEAGLCPAAFLAAPSYSPPVGEMTARLLAEAETLYTRAEAGFALLPAICRPAIRAASRLYREIGREAGNRGAAAFASRTIIRPARKARLVAGCLIGPHQDPASPALAETAFLVQAVPRPVRADRENGVVWVLELFARLDERDAVRGLG